MNSFTYKRRLPLALRHMGYTLLLFFTAQAQPVLTASLRGIVTNAASGEGLRKAYLRLAAIGKGAAYPVVTSDQGAFTIENIAPGKYRLDAECTGFLDTWYGGGAEPDDAVELRLSAGESLAGIEIKMTPQAVLSGRVLDQDGDPWPNANLSVFHSVWTKGRRHIEPADFIGAPQVDDRGEFRVAGLAPGRYYVFAEPDGKWEEQHHPDMKDQPAIRQQPTWYPSAANVESSAPLTVAAGQQLSGVDIRLRRGAGAKLRILGKLNGFQDIPALPSSQRQFGPRIVAQRVSATVDDEGHQGVVRPDGSFEIDFISSGTYDLWVRQGFPVSTVLGHAVVQVDDRDTENIPIDVHPPQSLHVSVRIEGDESARPPQIPVRLENIDFPSIDFFERSNQDGNLEFNDLGLGRYRVYVAGIDHLNLYLKTLRYGNAESADGTFALASYGVPLEAVFSTRGARLSGTVTGKAATPKVILIPDTPDAARLEHESRAAVFDQNGVFSIESIAPGPYKLYAFESVPEGVWLDPDFLKEVESAGIAFNAAEGDVKSIQIPLLLKMETDPVLAKLGIE